MANILESRTSYKTLFNDNQDLYCLPGLPEANDGPLAYLVDLYQQARLFESEADKGSARFLSQRRPDIEALLLDSTNLNKTSNLLPLVIEVLAQKVKAHINNNQPLTDSLAEIHYPLALPFHFPLKQTIAVLAEKEIPLLELIQQADRQYPNFIDNNLSSDSLQIAMMVSSSLAPKLQTLLQEKSQSDQKDFFAKYYGVKGDAAEAALSLSRLTVFTQQTNLSSQEAERLFAINGLSDNKITHSIVTYSSNVAKPTNAGKQFPSGANYAASFINAGTEPAIYLEKTGDQKTAKDAVWLKTVSNDNFDRIQRFLHIQKALKLTSEQLDLLLTTARQTEKQQDFSITEATLRALGVFLHFQQEYNATAEQFSAFIGQITPYALENSSSFFDRLFNAPGLSQQASSSSVLVLDNQEFDPSATEGQDALTVNQLCAGLNIDDATCQILLGLITQAQKLPKPKRSLDVVSALYRLVEFPRLLRLSVKEGLGLLLLLNRDNPNYLQQLAGVPVLSKNAKDIDILDVLIGVMNATQWIKRHELSTLSLNLLLTPYQPSPNGVTSEDLENIDWLKKVISILPDPQYALLSEDKIANAIMGFQAKNAPVNWMKSFSELVDEKMGIIQSSAVSVENGAEKTLAEKVGKILKELAEEEAWKAQGETWTQILTVLIRDAFIAQQDLSIKAISHAFNIDEPLSLPLLQWTGNNQTDFLRSSIAMATPAGDPQLKEKAIGIWYDLSRYAAIAKLFKLTAKTIQALIKNPNWFGLSLSDGKLRNLDLTFLHRLSRYGDWLDLLANNKTEDDVLYYLSQANQIGQTPPPKNVWTTEQAANNLAELIGWSGKEILQVTSSFKPNVAQNVIGVSMIMRLKVLAEESDISAQPLLDVAKLSSTSSYDHWQQVSSALFAACTSEEQTKLEGTLNELWRDALIEYLMGQWMPSDDNLSDITTIEDLSNYFLTDLLVAAEVSTSRVAFVIASLQRYLFRLFSRLETGYSVQTISDERIEHWNRNLSQYGHWQAWQKQKNFPENFIDPARRLRKTRAFADLENDLGQSRLNNDMIQTAILRYLTEFERISNLQLVSGYIDGTDPKNDRYHFIGKNNAEPVEYYWRTLDIKMRDNNDLISPLAWSEWEKITLSLSGSLLALRPIVISGRQYAIWVERESSPLMSADQKPSDYRAINVKFTYKQSNGEWSAPNALFRLDGTDANGEYPTKDGKRIPDKENPYLKDEKYKPALIAMVDVQREGEPWMGVLLYDTTKTDSSVWQKNQDYFLELRDLLLVDKKTLNTEGEKDLVSAWYKIFKNPDTLQHHYAGTEKFIELKPNENNPNLILNVKAKLHEDKTKLVLEGITTLIKRNPIGYGTIFNSRDLTNILSKLPSKEFNGTIEVDEDYFYYFYCFGYEPDSINIHIPASETSLKTFNLKWQGDTAPTTTFTVHYAETALFTVSPDEWKDNKVTRYADLMWLNDLTSQQSRQWDPIGDKLTISTGSNKASRGSLEFDTEPSWEYTESELTLKLDTPSGIINPITKNVELNGNATTGEITLPLDPKSNEYSFTLSATLETFFSPSNGKIEYSRTVSNRYQIIVRESDKIPAIALSRNDEQAQYLDIKSLGFKSTAIRLNTLFGKQLVAQATQSIERVLAWDTQSLSEPILDDKTSPKKVDFNGANGQYFWELFFHLPFLVTYRLSEEQRFYDARRWLLNYLFDPYGSMRMWNSRPITENGSNLPSSVRGDDPDTIAYSLPVYYQKALFHFQIKLWIQEGDNLYRQLTRDSLNEAGLCYQQALQLLGTLPEGLDATRWHPVTLEKIKTDFKPNVRVVDGRPFVSPFNIQLIEYQKTLNNRLYNLRHGLTLDGKVLPLPLYSGAGDDDSLIQRRAGSSISRWNNLQQQVPPYRFPIMLKRASDAVKQLIQMGHRLFSAIESEVNAEQEVLEQSQALRLSAFAIELQQEAVQIAQLGKSTLEESKKMAQERYDHYHNLYEENLSALEISALTIKTSSEVVKATAAPFYAAGAALDVVPNIFGMAVGGGKYSAPIRNTAIISELVSEGLSLIADRLQDSADYERRRQEWEIEYKQAQSEINIIDRQLQEQEVLIKSANTALREAQAQQTAARELYEFMTTGFLVVPTYQWLMGRLAALYAPAYDAVLSLCLLAETSWRYEVGDYQRRGFIKTTAWNDSYRGLLAGESLQLDLLQMENAWLQRNERRMNIKKTISLSGLLTASELQNQIEKKQSVSFTLNPKLFDTNYPGHYLRQIKRISLSISLSTLSVTPILSPEISAVLTQTGSSTLTSADIEGVNWLYDPSRKTGSSKNIVNNLRAQQQIALSSLSEDDGSVAKENWLYTLMFDDDRYLPFEGTGAISTWTLEFPDKQVINKIFHDPLLPVASWRLKDINIHVHYTAVDGGKQFAKAVKNKVGNT
ncbi:Tc toxin subunit A-related protein [Xenorhabdus bovienii]|uniref:Tc toxin subunit A-related protein n=1 Tax=Xenorhabdus bovienii TaxID=40576 RepID=UPI0023B31D25|nr:Tc toxin subunit A [Xenorhabdus bovienii]MDE9466326.1 hypothetical protein [Xenorhabdus bovienii]